MRQKQAETKVNIVDLMNSTDCRCLAEGIKQVAWPDVTDSGIFTNEYMEDMLILYLNR